LLKCILVIRIHDYFRFGVSNVGYDSTAADFNVLSATYTLSFATKSMHITNSLNGITAKMLLLVTADNDIFYIPTAIINSRRSTKNLIKIDWARLKYEDPTLPPYDGIIPYIPEKTLNTKIELSQITGIETHSSKYESTSFIASYGNDFYFLEFAPEKV
jgi:hypothetical protein